LSRRSDVQVPNRQAAGPGRDAISRAETLFLAVTDLAAHASFFASDLSSPFPGFFGTHLNCSPNGSASTTAGINY
jgi:hypothetical protein